MNDDSDSDWEERTYGEMAGGERDDSGTAGGETDMLI